MHRPLLHEFKTNKIDKNCTVQLLKAENAGAKPRKAQRGKALRTNGPEGFGPSASPHESMYLRSTA